MTTDKQAAIASAKASKARAQERLAQARRSHEQDVTGQRRMLGGLSSTAIFLARARRDYHEAVAALTKAKALPTTFSYNFIRADEVELAQ